MSYVKIRVEKNLSTMEGGIRHTIDEMYRLMKPVFTLSRHTWQPHTDIFETDSEIVVTSDLAGVNMEDIHVEINRNTLKIYGIRREMSHHDEDARYILAEIPSGRFERSFTFSTPVDTEAVLASYQDGLLHIRLKKRPSDVIRNIPIHCT
jgi:HSP20 family protein